MEEDKTQIDELEKIEQITNTQSNNLEQQKAMVAGLQEFGIMMQNISKENESLLKGAEERHKEQLEQNQKISDDFQNKLDEIMKMVEESEKEHNKQQKEFRDFVEQQRLKNIEYDKSKKDIVGWVAIFISIVSVILSFAFL
ncbi:MAG: hypothetical protein INQ03_13715 [Candidatus Heimdallarchaeota archaeon]|nr:hypothetical protein [Candidatus Heimdallarchaeota archaeon]